MPPIQPLLSREGQRQRLAGGGVHVPRADEGAHVAEDGVDVGGAPKLVDRDERVLERRREAHAFEPDLELALARIACYHQEVANLGAGDLVPVRVHDHVVAVADVVQVLKAVVHMPGAPAVYH